MNILFEKYLQETILWHMHGLDCETITKEEYLRRNGFDVDAMRQRVRDDFLIYRYYMKDSVLIKDCFYMQFNSISMRGVIRYESRISDSNKATMKIDECDFPKLTGPVTKIYKYVYRLDEDDNAVIQFFIDQAQNRKQELLQEMNSINKTLDYLLDLKPSALIPEDAF